MSAGLSRIVYVDRSSEFWPSGWMVWFCIAVGALDVSLIAFIVLQVVRH